MVRIRAVLLMGGLLAPMPVLAHHSFMAEFDQRQPVTLSGVVTAVKWQNPHTYFFVDAADGSGKTVNWSLETGSPNALLMRGWTRETMKQGDHVLVQGYRAKDGRRAAAARSVTFADGHTVFGGEMDDGGPAR